MTETPLAVTLAAVTVESVDRGRQLRSRIDARGIQLKDFAETSGVSEGTLHRMFRGDDRVRDATWGAAESAIARIEREHGVGQPDIIRVDQATPDGLMEIELDGVFGAERVVVRGPSGDPEALQAAVQGVLEKLRQRKSGDDAA
jgi:transcriptional regulator with XRE-family HTH domain